MTKHFCDRCGRQHHRLFKVGVTCCLYEFAPELGPYSDDGPQSGRWDTELCPDCLAWLKANWPFKVQAAPVATITKTLTEEEWRQTTPTVSDVPGEAVGFIGQSFEVCGELGEHSPAELGITMPKPFTIEVHIDGNRLSVKTPLASWEIDLKEATHDPHPV